MGYFFALISMICLGIGTFLYKKSTALLGPTHTTFFYYLFSIVIASVVWVAVREKPPVVKESLVWPALMAVFLCASVWTFSYSLKSLEISTASTIRGLSFLSTIALAVVFYKEQISAKDCVAIALAIGAVVIFGLDLGKSPG